MPKSAAKMWTALDANDRDLTPGGREFLGAVRAHGWTGYDEPDMAYTVGFQKSLGVPEVVVLGLDGGTARIVLRDVWSAFSSGKRLKTGVPYTDFLHDCPVIFQPVAKRHYAGLLGWTIWFYGGDNFTCWQMVLPDDDGRFPWQAGYDGGEAQADLSAGAWNGLSG